jgi:uncharacterized protein (DUF983 family)
MLASTSYNRDGSARFDVQKGYADTPTIRNARSLLFPLHSLGAERAVDRPARCWRTDARAPSRSRRVIDYMPHLNDACAPSPNTVLRCEAGGRAMATTVAGPAGSHDNDWTSAETAAGRNVGLSLWRGVRGRCPRCGRGRLFCAFLKVGDHCSVCRLDFTGHRADDLPAYLVIVIVGHVLVPVILWIEVDYAPSLALQLGVYLPITALASIALLQPVKGAVVALQWSLRMHGFGAHPPDEFQA